MATVEELRELKRIFLERDKEKKLPSTRWLLKEINKEIRRLLSEDSQSK